ncbi:MAG: aminotransferase class I/II-fold pyridoxal phosphate-dependent enzyme, partial [Acidimicrobiia bacterium]
PRWAGYPSAVGLPVLREAAAGWVERRFGIALDPAQVVACTGTKELVASLPHVLALRDPSRDTVLYPAVSYPTYEMGAILAGLRAVPVPLTEGWHLDLSAVAEEDAARTLLLWVNEPGNPTGSAATTAQLVAMVEWARSRGIIVASDECYVEFTYNAFGRPIPGATALSAGPDGVLVVHSLSKRSNMAGYRSGFIAGDGDLVAYVGQVRTHAGDMAPGPVQAAAAVAWADDDHVELQQLVYGERRAYARSRLRQAGLEEAGGPGTFYLWARSKSEEAGWAIAARLAETGTLVAPGDLYGSAGASHVRIALVHPLDRLQLAFDRIGGEVKRRAGVRGQPSTGAATGAG